MNMLYHYTSVAGFLGILSSRSLWATHTSFLNDSSEFLHGLAHARQLVGHAFMDDDYNNAFNFTVGRHLHNIRVDDIYVASFSEQPDLLSQWRGYCPTGAGLCLGFDAGALSEFCAKNGYALHKCLYSDEEQKATVRRLIEECRAHFPAQKITREQFGKLSPVEQCEYETLYYSSTEEGEAKLAVQNAIRTLCMELAKLAPLFKNQGFHEEAEWRVVAKEPHELIKFRANATYLAPYIELAILAAVEGSALREVIVGPNPNQFRCADSIQMALFQSDFHQTVLKRSSLPFNNW